MSQTHNFTDAAAVLDDQMMCDATGWHEFSNQAWTTSEPDMNRYDHGDYSRTQPSNELPRMQMEFLTHEVSNNIWLPSTDRIVDTEFADIHSNDDSMQFSDYEVSSVSNAGVEDECNLYSSMTGFDVPLDYTTSRPSDHVSRLNASDTFNVPGGCNPVKQQDALTSNHKINSKRLTALQTEFLETWLATHLSDPYPDRKQKRALATATGLSEAQVTNWFSRTRHRKLKNLRSAAKDLPEGSSMKQTSKSSSVCWDYEQESSDWDDVSDQSGGSAAPCSLEVRPSSPLKHSTSDASMYRGGDMEKRAEARRQFGMPSLQAHAGQKLSWWLSTLPDPTDYASMEAQRLSYCSERDSSVTICPDRHSHTEMNESTQAPLYSTHDQPISPGSVQQRQKLSIQTIFPEQPSVLQHGLNYETTPNDVSSSSVRNGGFSFSGSSVSSATSGFSACSYSSMGRRKGRRLPRSRPLLTRRVKFEHKYWCTFCLTGFPDNFRWKRHEESVHAPAKVWVCKSLHQVTPPCKCATTCSHRWHECWSKPASARQFTRRDALIQHFKSAHHFQSRGLSTDIYVEASGLKINLCCPFCDHTSADWVTRVDHVARHFESLFADGKTEETFRNFQPMEAPKLSDSESSNIYHQIARWELGNRMDTVRRVGARTAPLERESSTKSNSEQAKKREHSQEKNLLVPSHTRIRAKSDSIGQETDPSRYKRGATETVLHQPTPLTIRPMPGRPPLPLFATGTSHFGAKAPFGDFVRRCNPSSPQSAVPWLNSSPQIERTQAGPSINRTNITSLHDNIPSDLTIEALRVSTRMNDIRTLREYGRATMDELWEEATLQRWWNDNMRSSLSGVPQLPTLGQAPLAYQQQQQQQQQHQHHLQGPFDPFSSRF